MKGAHQDHGCAVYFTQGSRRCLLLDTTCGLTDDEAIWATLNSWANFQPRKRPARETPGQLYYPAEFSHVFEKYWNYLPNLPESPGFANESPYCQAQMNSFSEALSTMDLAGFTPLVAAEASEKAVQVSEEAAISRLGLIHGGLDFWGVHGGAGPGSGAPAPDLAHTML
jgi:hypothetical protein